jgi:cytochrome c6
MAVIIIIGQMPSIPVCKSDSNLEPKETKTMKTIIALSMSVLIAAPLALRAADAKTNWANNCTPCHGPTGKADTKMGKLLNAKDLADPKVQAGFTDSQAAEAIKNGVKKGGKTMMKAFGGKLSDEEIKALVAYVRTLKK